MERSIQGRYVTVSTTEEPFKAFVPAPLPPWPAIDTTGVLGELLEAAAIALGRLDGASRWLPNTRLLLRMFIRKEAVVSSMIEGTRSSISDLLLLEMNEDPEVDIRDTREVSRYVEALDHGIRRIEDGFPISNRLIRELHAVLMEGTHADPGEFRRNQNWIGGSRPGNAHFVPPPREEIMACMGDLETFYHDPESGIPILVKIALFHVQFETIHPFLDGNGRVGRLLIALMLHDRRVLQDPILYLSLHLRRHQSTYYDLLDAIRKRGDWEKWTAFFADAIIHTSEQIVDSIRELTDMREKDHVRIEQLGRAAESAHRVHAALMERPIDSSGRLCTKTDLTPITVNKALANLERLGIVHEITGRQRNRVYRYTAWLEVLERGTE